MKARIIRIGNSHGIRIPKSVLDQTGLSGEVELEVRDHTLTIHPVAKTRARWDEAFQEMSRRGDDRLLDPDLTGATAWDREDWQW